MEKINYYAQRLEFIIQLFKAHESGLLASNREKIRELLRGYKEFKGEPSYNLSLTEAIETFIL